jgi:hypothetical protein
MAVFCVSEKTVHKTGQNGSDAKSVD